MLLTPSTLESYLGRVEVARKWPAIAALGGLIFWHVSAGRHHSYTSSSLSTSWSRSSPSGALFLGPRLVRLCAAQTHFDAARSGGQNLKGSPSQIVVECHQRLNKIPVLSCSLDESLKLESNRGSAKEFVAPVVVCSFPFGSNGVALREWLGGSSRVEEWAARTNLIWRGWTPNFRSLTHAWSILRSPVLSQLRGSLPPWEALGTDCTSPFHHSEPRFVESREGAIVRGSGGFRGTGGGMVLAQYLRGAGKGGMFWPVGQRIWAGGGGENLYPPLVREAC